MQLIFLKSSLKGGVVQCKLCNGYIALSAEIKRGCNTGGHRIKKFSSFLP